MRKFKKGGKRGTSKKKMMRKLQSGIARQVCSMVSLLVWGFWDRLVVFRLDGRLFCGH